MQPLATLSSSSSIFAVLLLFLTLNGVVTNTRALTKLPPNVTIPALLVFGDSIVDTGNNNDLLTVVKCNFPPYGIHFQGGKPTGRFCDGKVPSDLIAEELGLRSPVPAYLNPTVPPQDLVEGVTFASGGTGYDPLTAEVASVVSMSDQLDYFKEYIGKLRQFVGENQTNFILDNSLFLVASASNDIANYFTLGVRKSHYSVPEYTDLLLKYASNFVQELYKLGARRVGVFSAPPIGCMPSQRTLVGRGKSGCAEESNQAAILFNSKLSAKLESLNSSLPSSRIVFIDVYNPLSDLIQNHTKYGFEVADRGCCGTGTVEGGILCNPLTPVTCSNVSSHVFWDSYHPTERTYRALVSTLLEKYTSKFG